MIPAIYPNTYHYLFYHPSYNKVQWLAPLLFRKFFLIPKRINKSVELRMCCPTSWSNHLCSNLINTWRFISSQLLKSRSQSPRGLRSRSVAARLLRLWVRIPPGEWMSVSCECCVSGRGLCDKLITPPEESYRLWCVVVCDLEKLVNEEALAHRGCRAKTNF
jgi:hypothetical protein